MRGVRLFGGKLKINLLIIPAIAILIVLGMGDIVLCTIPVIVIHEWAHVLAAAALGMTITEMELFPFGCAAKMQCFAMSRSKEIIVAAAGPAANMILACVIFVINKYYYSFAFADKLITASLAIATVNLLPALPLDGGRIARAAFASFMGYRHATRFMSFAGIFFAVVITGIGIYYSVKEAFNPVSLLWGFFSDSRQ